MTTVREPIRLPIALDAAEASELITAGGDRVFVVSTNQDEFEVSVDGGGWLPIGKGLNLTTDNAFTRVKFRNPNGSALTAEVVVSFWNYDDRRFHFPGTGAPVEVTNDAGNAVPVEVTNPETYPDTITSNAAAAVATGNHTDIAANADRRMLIIYNDHGTSTVWWCEQTNTASQGVPIGPKQALQVAFTGASRVRNNSGVSVSVYVTELE